MLKDFQLPGIETDVATAEYGRFVIGPMESGFGITVGNALRRVMMAALPGAAVTSVKLNDVYHEFSPIPHAREDTTRLLLNVKQLRLKSSSDNSVRLVLRAKGAGEVTAADIECPSDVEIINPDLRLLTLDSDEADFEMEFVVERGRGYSFAEERDRLPIGEIPVDALFSPVRRVSYAVDRARVGQGTSYDRLTIEVWTDGTISPEMALSSAANILMKHFSQIAALGGLGIPEEAEKPREVPSYVAEMPIEELGLSVRAYNCLKRAGISDVGEVLERLRMGDDQMLVIRNFGQKSLAELKETLQAKGIPLPEEQEPVGEEQSELPADDELIEDDEFDTDDVPDEEETEEES